MNTTDKTQHTDEAYQIALNVDRGDGSLLANLIAQRDELLEALKSAREILAPIVHKMSVREHFSEKNILANVIDKAIAKAEGSADK